MFEECSPEYVYYGQEYCHMEICYDQATGEETCVMYQGYGGQSEF